MADSTEPIRDYVRRTAPGLVESSELPDATQELIALVEVLSDTFPPEGIITWLHRRLDWLDTPEDRREMIRRAAILRHHRPS